MKKIRNFLTQLKKYLNGDFAYENYCRHATEHHEKILDKKTFLRRREKEKWQKVNRCC